MPDQTEAAPVVLRDRTDPWRYALERTVLEVREPGPARRRAYRIIFADGVEVVVLIQRAGDPPRSEGGPLVTEP